MVLGITRGATRVEIKKAYHKCALKSHPDKKAPEHRAEAEEQFKAIQQAFDILHDDEKREMYDIHGMAAFEAGGHGGHGGMGMEDVLSQMFGGGFGGFGGSQPPRRGRDENQEYPISLEEAYQGKTTQFMSSKNVVCATCSGTGGKEKAKPQPCQTCNGKGSYKRLQPVGPGLVTQATVECTTCLGAGKWYKDKDKCKRCHGEKIVIQKKKLELYIPPGTRMGEKIVLVGEADQQPGIEPGDIVFHIVETDHKVFQRAGADLAAELKITLAEALTGFERVVLTHLDGRGIKLSIMTPSDLPLEPGQIIRINGEGMPNKRSDGKGNLYLSIRIIFPPKGYFETPSQENSAQKIKDALPKPAAPIVPSGDIDERDTEFGASMEDFGAGSGDPRSGGEWEDDDDGTEGLNATNCAQQ